MNDSLNWIRKNDPAIDEEPKENLVKALSKLTGAPVPKKNEIKAKEKVRGRFYQLVA